MITTADALRAALTQVNDQDDLLFYALDGLFVAGYEYARLGRMHTTSARDEDTLMGAAEMLASRLAQTHGYTGGIGGSLGDLPVETVQQTIRDLIGEQGAADQPSIPTTEQAAETAPAERTTADIITTLRQAGRTVRQIAAAIGCAVSTVYRWARGVHRPSARYATALTALTA